MTQTDTTTVITGSLKILFDELGQQIQAQQDSGNRLGGDTGLFHTIESAGWSFKIGGITDADLADVDVLVLTNRVTQGYSREELRTAARRLFALNPTAAG